MDPGKLIHSGGTPQDFEAAMLLLAVRIREAGECLLDLQHTIERLRMLNEPSFALTVDEQTDTCLRHAMRQ